MFDSVSQLKLLENDTYETVGHDCIYDIEK